MTRLLCIAKNTFRENIREKLFYNFLVFAWLLIGSSTLLSRLTVGDADRLILDLGLASINLFTVLMAVFIGIGTVNKEIDKRTIYTVISKPVSRHEFLLGKYLGLLFTLSANLVLMTSGLLLVLWMMAVSISILLFKAIIFICLEVMVVAAVAVLYSTFTRATLSAVFTLAIYAIGHLTADLKAFGAKLDAIGRICVNAMYYILPNLERFNLKGHVIHGLDIGGMEMTVIISYGVIYTLFLLLMAMIIFQRRDFQ